MPPREDGASPKSFTWITGNPRSKRNITQIRRHAGQNSGVKAENGARTQASFSPKPGQRSSTTGPFRPVYPSPRTDTTDEHSPIAHAEQPISFHVNYPSAAAEYGAAPLATCETVNAFQPSNPGTPLSEVPPLGGENANLPRKLAIWDLVNHSVEEEERHRLEVLASTPGQDSEDDRQDYFGGSAAQSELRQILSEGRSHPPRQRLHRSSPPPPPATFVLQANIAKRRKPTSSATTYSHVSWRLGMPHSPHPISFSKEDSQIEQILLQTNAFYTGKFESSWSAHLREGGATYFDKISDVERFAGSITTAGGLLSLGRVDSASAMINRALPALAGVLTSQHPQVYYFFADLSLSASSDSALGRVRGEVKRLAAGCALKTLGHSHPITRLLHLTFPETLDVQRLQLRELLQRRVHELHEELFGPNSYQTTGQYYYLSRVLMQLGRLEESRQVLAEVVGKWEELHGANHIMPITGLLEMTRVQLSLHDSSLNTEKLLSEALRRTLTLEKSVSQESNSNSNSNPGRSPKLAGLVNARIGCIRTLGRLHVMRGNLETAMMQYTAAVSVGLEELESQLPAVQLALADLDAVSQMVRARAEGDERIRYEWLERAPVEVGLRWQQKERDVDKVEGKGGRERRKQKAGGPLNDLGNYNS